MNGQSFKGSEITDFAALAGKTIEVTIDGKSKNITLGDSITDAASLVEDLQTIIDIVQEVIDFAPEAIEEILDNLPGILDGSVAITDLELEFNPDKIDDLLYTIGESIMDLNLVEGRGNEIISEALKQIDLEIDPEILSDVVWHEELENAKEALELIANVIDRADINSLADIMDLVENLDVEELLNNQNIVNEANVKDLIDAVQIILDSEAVNALAEPLYEKYAQEMVDGLLDGQVAEILTFDEEFTMSDLLDDVSEILEDVERLLDIGVVDFITDGDAPLDLENTEVIGEVIESLASLNVLNERLEEIVELGVGLSGLDIDLSTVDFDAISPAADGELLADAYAQFVEEFDNTIFDEYTLNNIEDLMNSEDLLGEVGGLITSDNVDAVLGLVDNLVDLSLVTELTPAVFEYAKEIVPNELEYLVDVELSAEEINEDLHSIIDVIENILDITGNALDVIGENISDILADPSIITPLPIELDIENMPEYVDNILDDIDNLNIFEDRGSSVLAETLSLVGFDVNPSAFQGVVDREHELQVIRDVVEDLSELLVNNDLTSIESVMDVVNNLDTILESDLISDKNINKVLDIVDDVLESDILEAVLPILLKDAAEIAKSSKAPAVIQDILNIDALNRDSYDPEAYIEDLHTVVDIVREVVDMGAVDIAKAVMNGGEIEWKNLDNLTELVEQILDLNYLDNKQYEVLDLLTEFVGIDKELTDTDRLDIDAENEVVVELVDTIVQLVKELDLNSMSDINDLLGSLSDTEALVDLVETVLPYAQDVVELLSESGYVEELAIPAYKAILGDALIEALGENLGPLADLDFYLDEEGLLSEDLGKLADLIDQIDNSEIIGFVLGGEELNTEGVRDLGQALEDLLSLTYLESKEDTIINIANVIGDQLAPGGITLSDGDIDLAADGAALNDILNRVADLLESGIIEITTLDAIGDAISSIDMEKLYEEDEEGNLVNVDLAIGILKDLGQLSFLDEVIGIADVFVKDAGIVPENLEFLLDLNEKGSVGIVEDYNTIVGVVEKHNIIYRYICYN